MMDPEQIEEDFFTPSNKGAYTSLTGFLKNNSQYKNRQEVDDTLSRLSAYTQHKALRKRFKRRAVMVPGIDHIHTADLIDYQKYSRANGGKKWILIVVDVFSKFVFTAALKFKNAAEVEKGFQSIYGTTTRRPRHLWVDEGLEWYNKPVKSYLRSLGIDLYSTKSKLKAAVAEVHVKNLRRRIEMHFTRTGKKTWVDTLQAFTENMNSSYHSSIKMAANEVTKANEDRVWNNIYHRVISKDNIIPKYKVGDKVVISKQKAATFSKGFTPNFSTEEFIIDKVNQTPGAPTFKLRDLKGEQVESSFYGEELARTERAEK